MRALTPKQFEELVMMAAPLARQLPPGYDCSSLEQSAADGLARSIVISWCGNALVHWHITEAGERAVRAHRIFMATVPA